MTPAPRDTPRERPRVLAERLLGSIAERVAEHPEELLGKAPDSGDLRALRIALTLLRVAWQEFESGDLPHQYGRPVSPRERSLP